MRKFSNYFETIHDERNFVILRAVVFQDELGNLTSTASHHNFAVNIYENDERVFDVIEKFYHQGILTHFIAFHARKGSLYVLARENTLKKLSQDKIDQISKKICRISSNIIDGDSWSYDIVHDSSKDYCFHGVYQLCEPYEISSTVKLKYPNQYVTRKQLTYFGTNPISYLQIRSHEINLDY